MELHNIKHEKAFNKEQSLEEITDNIVGKKNMTCQKLEYHKKLKKITNNR
jgi:hypothetical protein